ncbi:hypothetical protein [Zhaonella formicivorans]|uniref:hypothetical protein n=1 Tax=Zhaonella formicivorans TaxID=2528593 RepID=UPI0010EB217D|nr:hypothetical protein [Zhaonella formicivorans]
MAASNIDVEKISLAVNKCCKTEEECGTCAKSKCLIGFAKMALEYTQKKNTVVISKGATLIPTGDYKVFYRDDLIDALVEVLGQCQDCQDNHEEDCVINIIRMALEMALLGEHPEYEGSAFAYLMKVLKQSPEVGKVLLEKFKER